MVVEMHRDEMKRYFIGFHIDKDATAMIGKLRDAICDAGGVTGLRRSVSVTLCAFNCLESRFKYVEQLLEELTITMAPFTLKLKSILPTSTNSMCIPVGNPGVLKKIQGQIQKLDIVDAMDFFPRFSIRLANNIEPALFKTVAERFSFPEFKGSCEVDALIMGRRVEGGAILRDFRFGNIKTNPLTVCN